MDTFPTKKEHLTGVLVCSSIKKGKILNIEYPEMDDSFVVITASDIGNTNRIRIVETYIPLLAKEEVFYYGQPIIILLGKNIEQLLSNASNIRISYKISNEDKEIVEKTNPIIWKHGAAKEVFDQEGIRIFEGKYTSLRYKSPGFTMHRVLAEEKNGFINIETATQWPFNIKNIISSVLEIPKNKIIVKIMDYQSNHDEYMVDSIFLSAYAAVATVKTGMPVEIIHSESVSRPEITINRKTAVNLETQRPLAEEIFVEVNQGAFNCFSAELATNLIASLIPLYQLRAIYIEINFLQNNNDKPASFFGDLGYSAGVISSETHFNRIAKLLDRNPYKWKMEHIGSNNLQDTIIEYPEFSLLKEISDEVMKKSGYIRKYAVYGMNKDRNYLLNPFINYDRGIGFAISPGIVGFSNSFQYKKAYEIELILSSMQDAVINTSFDVNAKNSEYWKTIVSEQLGIKKFNVDFLSIEDNKLANSGPSVLDRETCIMPYLLNKACSEAKQKISPETKYPLIIKVHPDVKEPLMGYSSYSWGASVVELYINPIRLIPEITSVWSFFSLPNIPNRRDYEIQIKHLIFKTLKESGANMGKTFSNNLTLIDRQEKNNFSFPEVRGVISAAYLSAIEQTQNKTIGKLPISPNEFFESNSERGDE